MGSLAWEGLRKIRYVCCCQLRLTALLLLQNGKTEYKSVTVAEDSTAEEFMDFYLDDDTRATWVSSTTSLLALNLVPSQV